MNEFVDVMRMGFEDVIDRRFRFAEAEEASEWLAKGSHVGKVVVGVQRVVWRGWCLERSIRLDENDGRGKGCPLPSKSDCRQVYHLEEVRTVSRRVQR